MAETPVPQGRDRRESERIVSEFTLLFSVKAPFEVRVQFGEKEVDAVAQDIGEGGLALITNGVIPIGTRIQLKFKIFNDAAYTEDESFRSFDLQGDVRYSKITKETDYRLGIQFVDIVPAERTFISNYIKSNKLRPSEG